MPPPRIVACPQCGKPVEWTPASRWRPFCSERCRLLDLGAWASGRYRIPLDDSPDADESSPPAVDRPPTKREK